MANSRVGKWYIQRLLYFRDQDSEHLTVVSLLGFCWQIILWPMVTQRGHFLLRTNVREQIANKSNFVLRDNSFFFYVIRNDTLQDFSICDCGCYLHCRLLKFCQYTKIDGNDSVNDRIVVNIQKYKIRTQRYLCMKKFKIETLPRLKIFFLNIFHQ